ncbi:MAG: hypothetical protein RL020_630, partial [Pseudomonadota bacterium]
MSAIDTSKTSLRGNTVYRKRVWINRVGLLLSMLAMAVGMAFLLWILWTITYNGFGALSKSLFTEMTPSPGSQGGLLNAIFGSLMMVGIATLIGTPIGILAGIYLGEFGQRGWVAPATRFLNDVLLSAPSIIIGLFVYAIYVAKVQHFSGWSGILALALLVIPVVVRQT